MQINKTWLRRAALIGVVGGILVMICIHNSLSLEHARAFLQTDQQIKNEFGEIKFDINYSARIKNDRSNFAFYVFAEKKNGTVLIEADEKSGVWSVYRVGE